MSHPNCGSKYEEFENLTNNDIESTNASYEKYAGERITFRMKSNRTYGRYTRRIVFQINFMSKDILLIDESTQTDETAITGREKAGTVAGGGRWWEVEGGGGGRWWEVVEGGWRW